MNTFYAFVKFNKCKIVLMHLQKIFLTYENDTIIWFDLM